VKDYSHFYIMGRRAGKAGRKTPDDCQFHDKPRRAAWLKGFADGESERYETERWDEIDPQSMKNS
jgi:ribosome modulation factor